MLHQLTGNIPAVCGVAMKGGFFVVDKLCHSARGDIYPAVLRKEKLKIAVDYDFVEEESGC